MTSGSVSSRGRSLGLAKLWRHRRRGTWSNKYFSARPGWAEDSRIPAGCLLVQGALACGDASVRKEVAARRAASEVLFMLIGLQLPLVVGSLVARQSFRHYTSDSTRRAGDDRAFC